MKPGVGSSTTWWPEAAPAATRRLLTEPSVWVGKLQRRAHSPRSSVRGEEDR